MPIEEPRTITVPYLAAIPVGHRVELRFFNESKGVFHKEKVQNPYLPLPPHDYPLPRRTDLEWSEVWMGRVTTCRVLTEAFASNYQVQTTLVIEPGD